MKTFKDLEAILAATEDAEYEEILRMADPDQFDSRDEFEDCFENSLGYNPMEYFDRRTIDEDFDEILEKAPLSVQGQLKDKKDEILERTLSYKRDVNENVLHKILVEVVKDTVGWKPIEDDDVSLDECILMDIFGEDVDSEDEDEEDYEDLASDEDDEEDEN